MRAAVEDEEANNERELQGELGKYLMPESLLSVGIVHILNNVQRDVDKSLPGWAEWFPGFKAMAYLIHHADRAANMETLHFCIAICCFYWAPWSLVARPFRSDTSCIQHHISMLGAGLQAARPDAQSP